MPSFSRWTRAQSALATSDPAVSEITTKEDFWLAWDVVGMSFAGDAEHAGEPVNSWMYKPVAAALGSHYQQYVTMMVALDRRPSVKAGGGFFCVRGDNGNIAAVVHACKMKGGKKPPNPWSAFGMIGGFMWLGAAKRIPDWFAKPKDPETKALNKQLKTNAINRGKLLGDVPINIHHKHGAKPWHYYVSIMAVLPTEQGKGHASRLMKAINRIADAEGVPLFLDCGSEKNVAVYKKMGYVVVEQQTCAATEDDLVTVYAMVREPGASSS